MGRRALGEEIVSDFSKVEKKNKQTNKRSVDSTELKTNIGGNAITAASFALAEACAKITEKALFDLLGRQYRHLSDEGRNWSAEELEEEDKLEKQIKYRLPTPMVNILNGGKHAGGKLKIQEFMIVPRRDIDFSKQLMNVTAVYHTLAKVLEAKYGKSAKNLGDEGGYAPALNSADEALKCIEESIEKSGLSVGADIFLALDCAASEFYNKDNNKLSRRDREKK